MQNIPPYVAGTFIAIVLALIGFLFYAVDAISPGKKNLTPSIVLSLLFGWIFIICIQTFSGFFNDYSLPPRLFLYTGFLLIIIILLFSIKKSRAMLNQLPITTLTYLHIVRVPVEMVIWWLAINEAASMQLTFEGVNFDIISGISAPFAAVFMIGGRNKNRIGAIIWNVLALGLLINVVVRAISYSPYFYDAATGSEHATIAIFYFPYILLPTFVVPVVFFSHLVCLNQLIFKKDQSQYWETNN